MADEPGLWRLGHRKGPGRSQTHRFRKDDGVTASQCGLVRTTMDDAIEFAEESIGHKLCEDCAAGRFIGVPAEGGQEWNMNRPPATPALQTSPTQQSLAQQQVAVAKAMSKLGAEAPVEEIAKEAGITDLDVARVHMVKLRRGPATPASAGPIQARREPPTPTVAAMPAAARSEPAPGVVVQPSGQANGNAKPSMAKPGMRAFKFHWQPASLSGRPAFFESVIRARDSKAALDFLLDSCAPYPIVVELVGEVPEVSQGPAAT